MHLQTVYLKIPAKSARKRTFRTIQRAPLQSGRPAERPQGRQNESRRRPGLRCNDFDICTAVVVVSQKGTLRMARAFSSCSVGGIRDKSERVGRGIQFRQPAVNNKEKKLSPVGSLKQQHRQVSGLCRNDAAISVKSAGQQQIQPVSLFLPFFGAHHSQP